jgi:hypothetical protein
MILARENFHACDSPDPGSWWFLGFSIGEESFACTMSRARFERIEYDFDG